MEDYFTIPVTVNGEEFVFEGRLLQQGYIHRIEVVVNDVPVLFEPDEERNYRALITMEQLEGKGKNLQREILQAISEVLGNSKVS